MYSSPPPDNRRRSAQCSRPPRRRRRRRNPLPVLFVFAFIASAGLFLLPRLLSNAQTTSHITPELTHQLRDLAAVQPEAQPLLDHPNHYPQELLELAVRNPEALPFVLDYPAKKDLPAAECVGTVTQGNFPSLLQWDDAWGYQTYGDGLMGLTGCGPTVLSMVICGLTGDNSVTPWSVAQYAQEAGWYVNGSGSSWDLMREGCRHYGLESEELPLNQKMMTRALENGHPIICSVGPGDFTTSGHFILLTDVEDGLFRVNDPNRPSNSEKLWSFETLAPQIRNLWACSPVG